MQYSLGRCGGAMNYRSLTYVYRIKLDVRKDPVVFYSCQLFVYTCWHGNDLTALVVYIERKVCCHEPRSHGKGAAARDAGLPPPLDYRDAPRQDEPWTLQALRYEQAVFERCRGCPLGRRPRHGPMGQPQGGSETWQDPQEVGRQVLLTRRPVACPAVRGSPKDPRTIFIRPLEAAGL